MLPCTTKIADLDYKPKGVILSGGPYSVYEDGAPHVDPAVFELGMDHLSHGTLLVSLLTLIA